MVFSFEDETLQGSEAGWSWKKKVGELFNVSVRLPVQDLGDLELCPPERGPEILGSVHHPL